MPSLPKSADLNPFTAERESCLADVARAREVFERKAGSVAGGRLALEALDMASAAIRKRGDLDDHALRWDTVDNPWRERLSRRFFAKRESAAVEEAKITTTPHEMKLKIQLKAGAAKLITAAEYPFGREAAERNMTEEGPHERRAFRGMAISCDVQRPGIVGIYALLCCNLNVICGDWEDAFNYRAGYLGKKGVPLDIPSMVAAHAFKIIANYSGLIPDGAQAGDEFDVTFTIHGIAAGG